MWGMVALSVLAERSSNLNFAKKERGVDFDCDFDFNFNIDGEFVDKNVFVPGEIICSERGEGVLMIDVVDVLDVTSDNFGTSSFPSPEGVRG